MFRLLPDRTYPRDSLFYPGIFDSYLVPSTPAIQHVSRVGNWPGSSLRVSPKQPIEKEFICL